MLFDIGFFRSIDVGVPVISIGNLTTGGTGKTPLVIKVADLLHEHSRKVCVVSRGYGRDSKGTVIVSDGNNILTDVRSAGDEPLLIARKTKAIVIVDENRVRGAQKAIDDFGAEVIILDDGFQHRRLRRTKDIVLMDSQRLPAKTMLIPAGYRRELTKSIRRADAVMVTKCNSVEDAETIFSNSHFTELKKKYSSSFVPISIAHVVGGVSQSLEVLKGHSAVIFSGIASPERFASDIESLEITTKKWFNFPDHYQWSEKEITTIVDAFKNLQADFIVTTEKDAMRLTGFHEQLKSLPIFFLQMDVKIHQQTDWEQFILS